MNTCILAISNIGVENWQVRCHSWWYCNPRAKSQLRRCLKTRQTCRTRIIWLFKSYAKGATSLWQHVKRTQRLTELITSTWKCSDSLKSGWTNYMHYVPFWWYFTFISCAIPLFLIPSTSIPSNNRQCQYWPYISIFIDEVAASQQAVETANSLTVSDFLKAYGSCACEWYRQELCSLGSCGSSVRYRD